MKKLWSEYFKDMTWFYKKHWRGALIFTIIGSAIYAIVIFKDYILDLFCGVKDRIKNVVARKVES